MILIGSRAINFWYPEFKVRENADWDIVMEKEEELSPSPGVEIHKYNYLNNYEIGRFTSGTLYSLNNLNLKVCSPIGLASIKRSHLHRVLKFQMHMKHYQFLLSQGVRVDNKFTDKRKDLTFKAFKNIVGTKNMSNEEFFSTSVNRFINHDLLHELVSKYPEPLYLSLKKDKKIAAYSDDLWYDLSHEDKATIIKEECYVIALERKLIPHKIYGKDYPIHLAYIHAMEKACTTLDDGVMREFAIDNWNELLKYDPEVLKRTMEHELVRKAINDYPRIKEYF